MDAIDVPAPGAAAPAGRTFDGERVLLLAFMAVLGLGLGAAAGALAGGFLGLIRLVC